MDREQKRALIDRLNRDAEQLARRFGLRYRAIEAERGNVKRRYGVCYSDGTIRIRLHHATSPRSLKYSSLVSTLCHELAHLRHFHHGPAFRELYAEILAHARAAGIYRPSAVAAERREPLPARPTAAAARREPAPGPTQLSLFG